MNNTVLGEPRQLHSQYQGTVTILIFNNSGVTLYLDSQKSDNIHERGFPIPAGTDLNIKWKGNLFIGVDKEQTGGATVPFILVKSSPYGSKEAT